MPFSSLFLITLLFLVSIDKNFTSPNFSLVNEVDLNRILRFEIFLHKDGQLCAAHVILRYEPISSSFESPKNVIKAKDPRLHQIEVTVPTFLTKPSPKGTHQIELLDQRAVVEEVVSSNSMQEEETVGLFEVVDSKEDFEVFDQPDLTESSGTTPRPLPFAQINSNQESTDIPKGRSYGNPMQEKYQPPLATGVTCERIHTRNGYPDPFSHSSSYLYLSYRGPIEEKEEGKEG